MAINADWHSEREPPIGLRCFVIIWSESWWKWNPNTTIHSYTRTHTQEPLSVCGMLCLCRWEKIEPSLQPRRFSTWPWPSMWIGRQSEPETPIGLRCFGSIWPETVGNGIQPPQFIHTPACTHKSTYRFAVCCDNVTGKTLTLASNLGNSAHGHGHRCGLAGSPNLNPPIGLQCFGSIWPESCWKWNPNTTIHSYTRMHTQEPLSVCGML